MELYVIGCVIAILASLSLLALAIKEYDMSKQDILVSVYVIIFASLLSWGTVFAIFVAMLY